MDCTKCALKGCRKKAPCNDRSSEYLENYASSENRLRAKSASKLIDNGRAGTLTRLEEIVEYIKLQGYEKIGVAYCYGMEKEAVLLRASLAENGLTPQMVSCTVDGVLESQIDQTKTNQTVSCNPLGQANILTSSGVQFTILMGLCLGHDILLQKNLTMDFTTFVVKDRVLKHNPLLGIPGVKAAEDVFVENIPSGFNLIKVDEFKFLIESGKSPEDFYLLDLRSKDAFQKDGIPGSINCLIKELPDNYKALLPDKKKQVIIYCNGGIQSVYGVMFLSLKGYPNVKSLAGGFSKYLGT